MTGPQEVNVFVNKMQQEASSLSTYPSSICMFLSFGGEFCCQLVLCSSCVCPGSLVVTFRIATQSLVYDGFSVFVSLQ